MIDEYVEGTIDRFSPESATTPVLQESKITKKAGGAGNFYKNLRSLTSDDIDLVYYGVVSSEFLDLLGIKGKEYRHLRPIWKSSFDEDILRKTRFICDKKHLLRVDRGLVYPEFLIEKYVNDLKYRLKAEKFEAVAISDYNKGMFTEELFDALFELSIHSDLKIFIDLKTYRPWFDKFKNLELGHQITIKCNKQEYDSGLYRILEKCKRLVVTDGKHGYTDYTYWNTLKRRKVTSHEAFFVDNSDVDVVGAGDVFFAGMVSYCLNKNLCKHNENYDYGNVAAGIRVSKFGKSVVEKEEVDREYGRFKQKNT